VKQVMFVQGRHTHELAVQGGANVSGIAEARSLPPLPERMVMVRVAKSRSFTRRSCTR
jgi:hypothetical protein